MTSYVPKHLGFTHISRQSVISDHTRPLAQFLFEQGDPGAILVIYGTNIYKQMSDNFLFHSRTYSIHKGRPLVKPMVICTTSGYYISILGPYVADSKNKNAAMFSMSRKKTSCLWDSFQVLEDLRIKTEILPRNKGPDALFSKNR